MNEAVYWELVADIESWLCGKRTTLWGQAFDLSQSGSKQSAARWLAQQLEDLYEWSDGELGWGGKLTADG